MGSTGRDSLLGRRKELSSYGSHGSPNIGNRMGMDHTGRTPQFGSDKNDLSLNVPSFNLQGSGGSVPAIAPPPSRASQAKAMAFATLNVSIAATGTGFLSFPFAFAQAGYLGGLALCVGTSLLCAYSLLVIATCARDHGARSYQELVLVMFGEHTRQLTQWLVIIFNFTGNIVSLQVIASQVASLLEQVRPACARAACAASNGSRLTHVTRSGFRTLKPSKSAPPLTSASRWR
jgi:hypothetical protein